MFVLFRSQFKSCDKDVFPQISVQNKLAQASDYLGIDQSECFSNTDFIHLFSLSFAVADFPFI